MDSSSNPYSPPVADLATPIARSPGPRYGRYRDTGFRAGITIVGLAASALLSLAIALFSPAFETLTPEDPRLWTIAVPLLMFAGLLSIFTIVTFCMWLHRTYANLPALGVASPRFTPGWVVGYFFIPIVNLFRPFQAIREAWIETEGALAGDTGGFVVERNAGLVTAWWVSWLGMNLVSNFQSLAPRVLDKAADIQFARTVGITLLILQGVATALAIAVVLGLTRRQRAAATARGFPPS